MKFFFMLNNEQKFTKLWSNRRIIKIWSLNNKISVNCLE